MYSILTVATYLFSYIIFTIYEHNGHQLKYFSENVFNLFNFLFCRKILKIFKYKNIQESGNCSQLILLLNITTNVLMRNTTFVMQNIVIK